VPPSQALHLDWETDYHSLAKETAIRSREVEKQDLQVLYEKVVLDEISIPEYLHIISNSVQGPAYFNVLKEIIKNLGNFS
jgi:hypothetical protein